MVFNAGGGFVRKPVVELTPAEVEAAWRGCCLGGFLVGREAARSMLSRDTSHKGTIIFTGATASLRGGAQFHNLAVGKFGLRALAQSMARELHPKGIHVAHVVIDGGIESERRKEPEGKTASLLNPTSIAATYLHLIHQPVGWLSTPGHALFSTVVMVIWRFAGFNMLILLTGLQAIPTDVYEAARMDGGNRLQLFRHITLPLLRPTIALMLVLSITGSLLAFDQFFILTRGGPDGSTVSIVMVIYREAFTKFNLGLGAAISVLLLAVLVLVNVLQLRILKRGE